MLMYNDYSGFEVALKCRGNYILCAKDGNLTIGHKKEVETIPISRIQSFVLKKPGLMKIGTITFRTAQATTAGVNVGLGVSFAFGGERIVHFDESELPSALQIQYYISHYEENFSGNVGSQNTTHLSAIDEIRALKKLLDEGILTQEEFEKKKQQLLGIL